MTGVQTCALPICLFAADIEANRGKLSEEIEGRSVLVIGGAGSIGSQFIRSVCQFRPAKLVVVDLSENGLALLTRDLRSTYGMFVPQDYRTYTLNFADPIFERIFREEKGFDIVANFSAHKHVRSEKDKYSVQALIENNDIKAKKLMDLLKVYPPKHFFCVFRSNSLCDNRFLNLSLLRGKLVYLLLKLCHTAVPQPEAC